MFDWESLCERVDVGALVPEAFSEYREPVADAMMLFLRRLSTARQASILTDQIALPSNASTERRLVEIARHSPILHKIGQLLARDRRLPLELRQLLQSLESAGSALTAEPARALVQNELGDLGRRGITISEEPLAEASMAVVIPFTWNHAGRVEQGVFKLLKPNIEQNLAEELEILNQVGDFLDSQCQRYGIPEIDYGDLFAQVRQLLGNEVDLTRERAHMESAYEVYNGWSAVAVPKLFPFYTKRLIAMERVDAIKVTELSTMSSVDRRRIASRLIEALVACPIWSEQKQAIFHADPHAGNLFVTDDRRLNILDWGLAGYLSKQSRIAVTQILISAVTLNQRRMIRAITDLAGGQLRGPELRSIVAAAIREVRHGKFPSITWLTRLLDDCVTGAGATFENDLLLFRKSLLMLDGVLHDLAPDFSPSTALAASLTMRLGSDLRGRILTLPTTRNSGTHLSNVDLWRLLTSGPITTARLWRGLAKDWITGTRAWQVVFD